MCYASFLLCAGTAVLVFWRRRRPDVWGAAFSRRLIGAWWREPLSYVGSSKARNQIGAVVSPKNSALPLCFMREKEVNCLTLTSSYSPIAPRTDSPRHIWILLLKTKQKPNRGNCLSTFALKCIYCLTAVFSLSMYFKIRISLMLFLDQRSFILEYWFICVTLCCFI